MLDCCLFQQVLKILLKVSLSLQTGTLEGYFVTDATTVCLSAGFRAACMQFANVDQPLYRTQLFLLFL